jgi:hypothetical protein
MLPGVREFFSTKAGYATSIALILVALFFLGFTLKSNLGPAHGITMSARRVFVCSETHKSFTVDLEPGMKPPLKSPYSGKNTGYEFNEVCTWTADGKVAGEPTYVLMNRTLGKSGPTFCPVCQRQVVSDNPQAEPDRKPPPTETEYRARVRK